MIQKLFATLAVSALILAVVAARAQSDSKPSTGQTTTTQTTSTSTTTQAKSATGKITSVSGETFSIEVGQGDSKQTMQFVTDPSTAKSGDLKVGSTATVQYQSGSDGKNTARKVDVQS